MAGSIKVLLVAVIVASGMVVSSVVLSKFFLRIRHEQAIEVKGYAEKNVVSDIGKLYCTFRARGATLTESYTALEESKKVVVKFLEKGGFRDTEIVIETIDTVKVPKRDAQGKEMNEIEFYDLAQSATITSTNVVAIRDTSTAITELIKEGIDLNVASPLFYVSKLNDAKVELLAQATEDGCRRATTLAQKSGGNVGALISAQQGVFQITEPNSTETSGYGIYDTSTIEKTVKATVTLEYEIRADKHAESVSVQ